MFRIKFIIFTALIAILPSCRPGGGGEFATDGMEAADTLTLHSRLLTIAELPESPATLVDIRSPWDSAAYLARYELDAPARFDVAEVYAQSDGSLRIQYLEDAFQ